MIFMTIHIHFLKIITTIYLYHLFMIMFVSQEVIILYGSKMIFRHLVKYIKIFFMVYNDYHDGKIIIKYNYPSW